MPKILLLDEPVYLTPDLLARLGALGEVTTFLDRPTPDQAIRRLSTADIAIVRWTPLTREMFDAIRGLKYVIKAGTGFPQIDELAAREHGVPVSNIPDYCRQSVAEHVFALLLALNRRVADADSLAKSGYQSPPAELLGFELVGKTLGVIGLGRIGSWVARIGRGFGMRTLAYTRTPKGLAGVDEVDLESLLAQSDVVSVNVSLNDKTLRLLSRERLCLLKPSACLICTANARVLDEEALYDLLASGNLAGAGIDSACRERRLRELGNVILTPGMGWYTVEAQRRLGDAIIESVASFLEGRPRNLKGVARSQQEHEPNEDRLP